MKNISGHYSNNLVCIYITLATLEAVTLFLYEIAVGAISTFSTSVVCMHSVV